jgi:hypothetical protein
MTLYFKMALVAVAAFADQESLAIRKLNSDAGTELKPTLTSQSTGNVNL